MNAGERCTARSGVFHNIPIGKASTADTNEGVLKGRSVAASSVVMPPEDVRYLSEVGGGDFCLSYGTASALCAFGDTKLAPIVADNAEPLEKKERQMQALRDIVQRLSTWTAHKIVEEELASFDPLVDCNPEHVYVLHLKQTDGATDHAVAVARGRIYDANRPASLPLSREGLVAIHYRGLVQATRLVPSQKVAAAIEKQRKRM